MLKFKIFKLNNTAPDFKQGSVLTIGNFDGVHLGHQALLDALKASGNRLQLPTMVVIFEPQPKEFFMGSLAPFRLFSLREKIHLFKTLQIDYVVCIGFNLSWASLSSTDFIHQFLIQKLHAKFMLIGPDFHFGRERHGTPKDFCQIARLKNVATDIFPVFQKDGEKISSTRIRQLCSENQFTEMESCLGFPYFYLGRVVYGRQLAGSWGIPTANIRISAQKKGLNGVFCVKIKNCSHNSESVGVANIGLRPTIDGVQPMLEVHLLNENINLYGVFLQVVILKRLRDERRFSSLAALKQQIQLDVLNAKTYFEEIN
ncbi:MAG: bifunctional riboflavin kinase/FAD synthetase [Gammaproteobacteria bacterium]|nr:bifunctional riboflavin kinase/FAD synthetase [Gammaproteobacteria bacterium]